MKKLQNTVYGKKVLFAIASEKTVRKHGLTRIVPQLDYVHAVSEGEARWIFAQDADAKNSRIVAVGPAIGYFVEDNHGDVLTA